MRTLVAFCVLTLAVLFASGALAEPNLVGTWQGPLTMHAKERGLVSVDGQKNEFVIKRQQDGAFWGVKSWNLGSAKEESFSGVISPDGKRFYFAEHEDGIAFGEIVNEDVIVVYYLEDGPKAKAMRHTLVRKK